MYIEGCLIARKMSYTAQFHHYDPLHLCSRRSSAFLRPPSPHPHRQLQTQTLAFYSAKLCRGSIFKGLSVGVFTGSNSRAGALSQKVFINTDDVLSSLNWRVPQQHGNKRHISVRIHAFNPQGGSGGGGGDGTGRTIFNLAAAGLLTYLTVTGRLNWLFDAILSLWFISAVLWWFAERSLIRGLCPNCGGEFQVFEFSLKEEHRLCPYCSQPFKLENKKFVRDEPQFSNQQTRGSKQPFGGFRGFEGFGQSTSSRKKEDSSGVIVDIEAEVRDKD